MRRDHPGLRVGPSSSGWGAHRRGGTHRDTEKRVTGGRAEARGTRPQLGLPGAPGSWRRWEFNSSGSLKPFILESPVPNSMCLAMYLPEQRHLFPEDSRDTHENNRYTHPHLGVCTCPQTLIPIPSSFSTF